MHVFFSQIARKLKYNSDQVDSIYRILKIEENKDFEIDMMVLLNWRLSEDLLPADFLEEIQHYMYLSSVQYGSVIFEARNFTRDEPEYDWVMVKLD